MDAPPPGYGSSPLTIFAAYAQLYSHACSCLIGYLCQPRFPHNLPPATIPAQHTHDNAIALLRYHFDYTDFIRSMAFIYTYQGHNLYTIWDLIDSIAHLPHAPSWPAVDFDHAFHAMTLGVPLASQFCCSYASVSCPNLYDNHPAAKTPEVLAAIRTKFIKEEDLSYNVVFPRWIWRFIFGLFLNPLTFVLPKYSGDLGWICVDSTNALDPSDDGAPNRQIPKPSTPHHLDENPPISYGLALQWCLTWIYNVRLDHPSEDILMLPDDISTAFHQLFYHPSMMPVFASIFKYFLCIPASMIFGSTNSPSYYMLSGDLRSWLSSIRDYGQARVQVMDSAVLPPAPSTQQIAQFRPAFPNVFNHGAASMLEHSASALYPVFVNDTGNAHICSHIILTVMASVLSTYIIFGFPGGNPWANRPPPVSMKTSGQTTCLITLPSWAMKLTHAS